MTRILLVDDKAIVRAGVKRLLERAIPGVEVEEANGGKQALKLIRSRAYAVVFLDITMRPDSGLVVLESIRATNPELPVVMLTVHEQSQYVVASMRAGAMGFVAKDASPRDLAAAVDAVTRNQRYLCTKSAAKMAEEGAQGAAPGINLLTTREYQVFLGLSSGTRLVKIAADLGLDHRTVSTHKRSIYKKLGCASHLGFYEFLATHGLLSDQEPGPLSGKAPPSMTEQN